MAHLVPAKHQPKLDLERFLVKDAPNEDEAVPMDVVFVGAGPAGLAGAIELARLVKKDAEEGGDLGELEIGVLEKAAELGQHNLSGAVINPRAMQELFPDLSMDDFPFRGAVEKEKVYLFTKKRAWRIPAPPPMWNHGNQIASICEVVGWLGEKAEEMGVNVFTGFPVESLLVDGSTVRGVRTVATGLNREGEPGAGYEPAGDITARVTVLSEGSRGPLAQAWQEANGVGSPNPQIHALGVKEIWEVKKPLDHIIHTLGWPLPRSAFGGSFVYPLADDLVAIGLVVGLDYERHDTDVHRMLQEFKAHPHMQKLLEGGELVEWGAKTIPEGGWHALPDRLTGDGVLLVGDAAGLVDVPSLKGIHYAMHSGILAARAIFEALKKGDVSAAGLASYDESLRASYVAKDLKKRRNIRLAFKSGFFWGAIKSFLMILTKGWFPGGRIQVEEDAAEPRTTEASEPYSGGISKVDAVFKSGNQTRDDIPSHLTVGDDVPPDVAKLYEHLCPAGVYEATEDGLVVNAPNCVDCRATDILGPRWSPREGGSGPKYKRM
ncbi:MAG: electron-transfer flavoprotein:ubiquinone oxidoreductase [Planctomycetota bacterium]|nr:electron-transfer flavoprotein:ubiquinone oxidoreductase [Planctomycetota bacterium]